MKINLEKEFVKDKDADQLVGACLLQFPYGRCGLDEERLLPDGSLSSVRDVSEFISHLSRLSKNEFQTPMIQLIGHTMISRARLLKISRLQVKGEKQQKILLKDLYMEMYMKVLIRDEWVTDMEEHESAGNS